MLVLKEKPVFMECDGEVLLFPDVKLQLKWDFGVSFFRSLDKYGKNRLWVIFPLNARLKDNTLLYNGNYTTVLLWGTKIQAPGSEVLTIPDWDCPVPGRYYTIVSALRGTKSLLRDEDGEEMELTF